MLVNKEHENIHKIFTQVSIFLAGN